MKIQMTINEKKLPDHLWLDPSNPEFDQNYGKAIEVLEDGEPTLFYAPQFLNYIAWPNLQQLFGLMHKKLRKGGSIVLGGVEPYVLSKKLVSREISIDTYNKILFPYYVNLIPLPDAKMLFQQYKYKIEDINLNYDTYQYTVRAVK